MKTRKALPFLMSLVMLLFVFLNFGHVIEVRAQNLEEEQHLYLRKNLNEWILDEKNRLIYAISDESKSILFLHQDNLTMEKEIVLESKPTDIELYQGKLYIPLPDLKQILVVDPISKTVKKTIQLDQRPDEKIAVYQNKVYYVRFDLSYADHNSMEQYRLFQYDLSNNKESEIILTHQSDLFQEPETFPAPDLVIDRENHVLYIGESGNAGSALYAVNLLQNSIIQRSHQNEDGFYFPVRKVLLNHGEIFYAKHRFDANNVKTINGSYDDTIIYADQNYAFSKNAVYNRKTFNKLSDLPLTVDLFWIDSLNQVYVYNSQHSFIQKFPLRVFIGSLDHYQIPNEILEQRPQNFTSKLDEKTGLTFTWDAVENAQGYNIYYKIAGKDELVKLNDKLVKTNTYTIANTLEPWYNHIAIFSVTAIVNNEESRLSNPVVYGFNRNSDGNLIFKDIYETYNKSYADQVSQRKAPAANEDELGRTFTSIEINNETFGQLKETKYNYELKIDGDFENISLVLLVDSYKKIKKSGKNLVLKTNIGNYILPMYKMNETPYTSYSNIRRVIINISKLPDYEYIGLLKTIEKDGGRLITEPLQFQILIDTMLYESSPKFLSTYLEHWIPLKEQPNKNHTVGIVMDQANDKYPSVPTAFVKDAQGNYWAVLKSNKPHQYLGVITYNKTFKDIKNHWAKEDIEVMASKLIVNGMSDAEFSPNKNVTRAQYVTLLAKALALSPRGELGNGYRDLKPGDWYADSFSAAAAAGIVKGYSDETYKPNKTINREEMITMTIRALEYVKGKQGIDQSTLGSFTDRNQISDWGRAPISLAVKLGLVKGHPDGRFAPLETATRAESGVVIKRLLEHLNFIDTK
jgi:hypothetical protein